MPWSRTAGFVAEELYAEDMSESRVAFAESAYISRRLLEGSDSDRSMSPRAAIAAAEESRGAVGMSGAMKSQ